MSRDVGEVPAGEWFTAAYHRPLSWYVRALRAAGLALITCAEPEPTAEMLAASEQAPWIAELPFHCVIEAMKMPQPVVNQQGRAYPL